MYVHSILFSFIIGHDIFPAPEGMIRPAIFLLVVENTRSQGGRGHGRFAISGIRIAKITRGFGGIHRLDDASVLRISHGLEGSSVEVQDPIRPPPSLVRPRNCNQRWMSCVSRCARSGGLQLRFGALVSSSRHRLCRRPVYGGVTTEC